VTEHSHPEPGSVVEAKRLAFVSDAAIAIALIPIAFVSMIGAKYYGAMVFTLIALIARWVIHPGADPDRKQSPGPVRR
jgi:hypothetical protein